MVGVFVVGFLMCFIGGWLFGWIVDCWGCKMFMFILVCMMCFGLLVIVCLLGYVVIGIWVLVLLLLVCLFQGLFVGGEYGISVIYMSEVVVEGKKGFYVFF